MAKTQTPEHKPKNLTFKQKKFVKAYVANDGNGTEAALQAYNTVNERAASAIASENLTKPNVQQAIEIALVKHGITMDAAIKPIADGLKATRSLVNADHEVGQEVADHAIRLKASGMALKLMGAEQKETNGNTFIFTKNTNFNAKKYTD